MKKLTIFLIIIVLLICSTACSLKSPTADKGNESSSQNVLLSREEKQQYLNEPSYYGVGRTINAIEDEYIDVDGRYSKIFDENKLLDLNWHTSFVGQMESSNIQAASMSEFYSKKNASYELALATKTNVLMFSAGLDSNYNFASGGQYSSIANEVYYQAYQYYASHSVEIDERTDLFQFKSIIKPSVLEDARDLSPQDFFAKYGTHVILAAYYGGKIEYNYYLCNSGLKWDTNTELKMSNGISACMGQLSSLNVDSNFSIQTAIGANTSTTYSRFYASAMGGSAFKALNEKDFIANYGEWVDSMNGKSVENSRIVGLPVKSLVAIWELFPVEYSAEKNKIAKYFNEQAEKTSNEFLQKYQRKYYAPSTFTINVRDANSEVKVSQGKDIYDHIDIPFDYSELTDKNGKPYNNVVIKVSFQLKETGTCYQHVDLLDGKRNPLCTKTFEQGGHNMTPFNKYEPFEYVYQTSIADLMSRNPNGFQLWLKYYANGNGWDANEFLIKDVKVTFTLT